MKTKAEFTARDFAATRLEIGRLIEKGSDIAKAEISYQSTGKTAQSGVTTLLDTARAKWKAQSFQIAVMALAKSGKSMLLNSWLGDEYLPSSSAPETARIVRIRHNPSASVGVLTEKDEVKGRGAQEVRAYLRQLNENTRRDDAMPPEDELVLEASLLALADAEFGDQRFELLDTPGPNEAGTDILRAKVERLLDEVDVIVYLLDYTKLKTEEEKQLFEKLASLRPELIEGYEKRLFFAVNKVDEQDRNGLTREQTSEYVAGLLRKQLGLKVPPERILPVSSRYALLARLVASGRASGEAIRDFAKVVLGILTANRATAEMCRPHADELLTESNVQAIEGAVLTYVFRDRGRLLVQSLLGDLFKRALDRLENQLNTALATLRVDHEEMARRVKKLEADLKETERQIDVVGKKTERFRQDTEKWARTQFEGFAKGIIEEIGGAFDSSDDSSRPRGLKARLVRKIKELMGFETQDFDELEKRVVGLNRHISRQLASEFEAFQLEFERGAQAHQRELFREIEEIVAPLLRQVEEKVSEALKIKLNPVKVTFELPSLDSLHSDIERKISSFVNTTKKKETTYESKKYRTKKGGWCSDDEYGYRDAPRTRTVTKHGVNVNEIKVFWSAKVSQLTEVSVHTAAKVIESTVQQTANAFREELARYCTGYMKTIERELEEKRRGEAQWKQRLRDVESRLSECRGLRDAAARCEEFVK